MGESTICVKRTVHASSNSVALPDRYQRLNDNLLTAFCTLVSQYTEEASAEARQAVYLHKLQSNEDTVAGAQVLGLFLGSELDGRKRFAVVRQLAYQILEPRRLKRLCHHLTGELAIDEAAYEWQAIDVIMRKAKRTLRPLIRFLALQGGPATAEGFVRILVDRRLVTLVSML